MPTSTQENHSRSSPQKKLLLFVLKCVIMVFIISLFLFFLGFAAIVIIHFLFLSTAFHRRCYPASEALPYGQTLLRDVIYSTSAFPMMSDCAICLDFFQEGDICRNIPACKHLFHAKCVDTWIVKKPTCPVCRVRVDLCLPGSETEGGDQWKRIWAVNMEEGTSY